MAALTRLSPLLGRARLSQTPFYADVVLALLAVIYGPLALLGLVPFSSERGAEILVTLAGVIALAFALEAAERRRFIGTVGDIGAVLRELRSEARVRQVPPDLIGREVDDLLSGSDEWLFRGGSARYLRGSTLPHLGTITTRDVPLFIALLDPRDRSLCNAYANYRSSIGRRDPDVSAASIQAEILGTIYVAAWYSARKRLRAKIVLLRSFSQLRYDIGSTGLLVTVADKSQPGLYAGSDTWYYASVRDEIEQSVHGNPTLSLPSDPQFFPARLEEVTEDIVKAALADVSAGGQALLEDEAARQIAWTMVREAAVNPREPNT